MNILARTIFHTHVDDQSHAEVTQVVVIFFRGCGANEQVIGDGGEVQVEMVSQDRIMQNGCTITAKFMLN